MGRMQLKNHLKPMNQRILKKLKKLAQIGASNAYCPYSKIHVGAAVITENNKFYYGSNIENISFGGTICAERVAITKAISEGHRKIKCLYLYTSEQWSPCGMCLQVMSEFLEPSTMVILGSSSKEDLVTTLESLLPRQVDLKTFKKLQK